MLDLNRLRILRSVVASGSVNETARLLGYRPSTVSQHLHTLEREVGLTLIERVGRGIRPTPAAIELADAGVEALDAVSRLDARVRSLKRGTSGKLTIRTFATAAYAWMPSVVRTLRQEFDGLELELSINEIEDPSSTGQADVEVHTDLPVEAMATPRGYHRFDLGLDEYVMAIPSDHPLAGGGAVDLAAFAADEWVHFDFRDAIANRLVSDACAEAGFTPRYVARAQDHVTGLAFVAAGVGVTAVPGLAAHWSSFDLAYVGLANPTPTRRIVGLIRKGARTNPAAARTVELLTDKARRLGDRVVT